MKTRICPTSGVGFKTARGIEQWTNLIPSYFLWGLLGLALNGGNVFGAGTVSTPVHTVDLEYTESSEVLFTQDLKVSPRTQPFPKEPVLQGKEIQRGSLAWVTSSNQFIPYYGRHVRQPGWLGGA